MKRLFLLFVLTACGGDTTTTGADASADSSNDVTTTSDASSDASSDAAPDSSTGSDGGGLGAGEICDPQNNECQSGLLCCSEPTHMADAMTAYFCEKPTNNGCPLLP